MLFIKDNHTQNIHFFIKIKMLFILELVIEYSQLCLLFNVPHLKLLKNCLVF